LDENYFKSVLDDIFVGRSISLGGKLYKIRSAGKSKGKSGGFRNIFYWKKEEFIIFCYIFSKNERENLVTRELHALKILSDEYSKLTSHEIDQCIKNKIFMEVRYDKKEE